MHKTILVVDDDPVALRAIAAIVESAGCTVQTATSGEQGYLQACQDKPDCIILDIHMAGMDGGELAGQLRLNAVTRQIPIIFCTGLITSEELPASGLQ